MRIRGWLTVLTGFVVVSACVTYLCAAVRFTYHHPRAPQAKFTVQGDRVLLVADKPSAIAATNNAGPRVATRQVEYDFGEMAPHEDGERVFIVDNRGGEPLELSPGGSSCKCTFAELPDAKIAPGESGHVVVQWNTGKDIGRYVQSATVLTNDPQTPQITFRVAGAVHYHFALLHESLNFEQLGPDQPQVRETLLYSHDWDDLIITDISSTLDGLTWELEPLDAGELSALEAKSAYRLVVHSPHEAPTGHFEGAIHIVGAPRSDPTNSMTLQLPVAGKMLRRLSVYGDEINSNGLIDLGLIPKGQERQWRLLVRVRDEIKDLPVVGLEVVPNSLEAEFTPFRAEDGLYYLNLRVRRDAGPCMHLQLQDLGAIRLQFDHPRIKSHEFPIRIGIAAVAR